MIAICGGVDVEGVRAGKGFVSGSVGRRRRGTAVVPTAILDFRLEILNLCLESTNVVFERLEVLLCPRFLCGFLAPGALCATKGQQEYAKESKQKTQETRQRKVRARFRQGAQVDAGDGGGWHGTMRVRFGQPRMLRTSEARPAFSHGPQTGARPSHFDFLRA